MEPVKNTQIFRNFENLLDEVKFPLITVYFSPEDYPRTWVARLFDTEKPTKYFALANSLQDMRKFKPLHMSIFQRDPRDVTSIKEIWI